jgi:hypothetical protein
MTIVNDSGREKHILLVRQKLDILGHGLDSLAD